MFPPVLYSLQHGVHFTNFLSVDLVKYFLAAEILFLLIFDLDLFFLVSVISITLFSLSESTLFFGECGGRDLLNDLSVSLPKKNVAPHILKCKYLLIYLLLSADLVNNFSILTNNKITRK